MSHTLFNSIFTETHPELTSLNTNISSLQNIYQSTYIEEENNSDEILEQSSNETNNFISSNLFNNIDNNIFSQIEINNFYKIFNQKSEIFISEVDKKQKAITEQDINAFCNKFDSFECCSSLQCTKNIINREIAIKKWKNIQMMSKDKKNMFLLGILSALVRKETTQNNREKKYLTNEYQFDGSNICSEAFLLIYDISGWKWKSIRKHFLENDILPITHQLKGKNSNNKITFEIIINILIFISNYANIHGLPSPGIV